MHCSAHQILENLNDYVDSEHDQAVADILSENVRLSHKFVFDFSVQPAFVDFGVECFVNGIFRLPFRETAFEFQEPSRRLFAHMIEVGKRAEGSKELLQKYEAGEFAGEVAEEMTELSKDPDLVLQAFVWTKLLKNWEPYCNLRIKNSNSNLSVEVKSPNFSRYDMYERDADYRSHMIGDGELISHSLLGYWSALNSKTILVDRSEASRKLNDRREKKGKPPLCSFSSVKLDLPKLRTADRETIGTHASPTIHFRRGHLRHLPNDKVVPVAPCIVGVGDESFFPPLKDYIARLGEADV